VRIKEKLDLYVGCGKHSWRAKLGGVGGDARSIISLHDKIWSGSKKIHQMYNQQNMKNYVEVEISTTNLSMPENLAVTS
jgi:hypothetical protein